MAVSGCFCFFGVFLQRCFAGSLLADLNIVSRRNVFEYRDMIFLSYHPHLKCVIVFNNPLLILQLNVEKISDRTKRRAK